MHQLTYGCTQYENTRFALYVITARRSVPIHRFRSAGVPRVSSFRHNRFELNGCETRARAAPIDTWLPESRSRFQNENSRTSFYTGVPVLGVYECDVAVEKHNAELVNVVDRRRAEFEDPFIFP